MFVYLTISNKHQNNPIETNFLWQLTWAKRRFIENFAQKRMSTLDIF